MRQGLDLDMGTPNALYGIDSEQNVLDATVSTARLDRVVGDSLMERITGNAPGLDYGISSPPLGAITWNLTNIALLVGGIWAFRKFVLGK